MATTDPAHLPLFAVAAALRERRLSAGRLVEVLLERIAARDDAVRAWVHLDPDQVRRAAARADAAAPTGALHGVPIGLKDIIDTAAMPTRYGSQIYRDHRPAADAVLVRRLTDAGAIIMGKTVTTEFAYFTPRETRNPHDPGRTPGGSSSGSAAAVADDQVPAALGTQTSGSVIRPASFCGVIGYKPAFGEIPTKGVHPFAPSVDTVGVFVRHLQDIPLLMAALTGRPAARPTTTAKAGTPHFAVFRSPYWQRAEPASRAHLEAVADALSNAGAAVRDLPAADDMTALGDAHATITAAEAAVVHDRHWRYHRDQLSPRLVEIIERGRAVTPQHLLAAKETAKRWRRTFGNRLRAREVILTLSAPGEAPVGLAATGDPIFNILVTILHLPAIHLPTGSGPAGLPIGVQLAAARSAADGLLAAAGWVAEKLALPGHGPAADVVPADPEL